MARPYISVMHGLHQYLPCSALALARSVRQCQVTCGSDRGARGGGAMRRVRVSALAVAAVLAATGLAACGSGDDDSGTTATATASPTTAAPAETTEGTDTTASTGESKCGLGNGQKATGDPIKIG